MTRGRRIHAARYLRSLATIETLSALGNDSEVRRLLASIDAEEARELASEIESAEIFDLHGLAARMPVPSRRRAAS